MARRARARLSALSVARPRPCAGRLIAPPTCSGRSPGRRRLPPHGSPSRSPWARCWPRCVSSGRSNRRCATAGSSSTRNTTSPGTRTSGWRVQQGIVGSGYDHYQLAGFRRAPRRPPPADAGGTGERLVVRRCCTRSTGSRRRPRHARRRSRRCAPGWPCAARPARSRPPCRPAEPPPEPSAHPSLDLIWHPPGAQCDQPCPVCDAAGPASGAAPRRWRDADPLPCLRVVLLRASRGLRLRAREGR